MKVLFVWCMLGFMLLMPLASGATPLQLHVSTQGDDAASGTAETPLASLAGARDRLRTLRRETGLPAGAVVTLEEGTYPMQKSIVFAPEDSGTADGPIVFQAAPKAKVVISGGRRIDNWRQEGDFWVATIPDVQKGEWSFSNLWVNGQRRQPARSPNPTHPWGDEPAKSDTFNAAGPVMVENAKTGKQEKSNTKFHYHESDIQEWASLEDAVFVIYHSWATSLSRLKSIDREEKIVEFTGPARWPFGRWQPDQRFFVEHLFEGLDQPGEWYLNKKTGQLFYYPFPSETLEHAEVIAPVAQQLLKLSGAPEAKEFVEHLQFKGLSFQHTEFPIAIKGHSDSQAAFKVHAAIETLGARHCVFENVNLSHLGNYGVWFRRGSQHNVLRHSELFDLGAGGVRIGEGASPALPSEATEYNVVDNNFIHEGGRVFRSAVGVWIGRSSHNEVTHNEICDFRYTGISVGWSWGYADSSAHHNQISDNHIHHIGRGQLNDMGGIYCLGISPGTVLRGNVIHDVISHPRLYGGWGLYTDEGSTDILMENNLVYNTTTGGFHQHYGRDNIVRNNVFAYSHGPQIIRSREEDHNSFSFQHNIVYFNNGKTLGSSWKNGNWVLDNNIYWDTTGRKIDFSGRSFEQWQAEGHDTHSLIADPGFIDGEAGDFRLKPDAVALSIGFKPFDFQQAGLYGEAAWVAKPKEKERARFTPPFQLLKLTVAPVGPNNPRNSEAAIIQLKNGDLLLGWTEFYAGSGADHGPARISGKISSDGGRTWGNKYTLIENDGGQNVMEVNFLRLKNTDIALFYCQKNTESTDCRVMMRTSTDEGQTFGPAKQLSPAGKYTGLTNGRSIRLGTGRILLEAWEDGDSYCYFSDDEGESWHESQRVQPADGKSYEPACVELNNGDVMMLLRTGLGSQYKSISKDGGESWDKPVATPLVGTAAPVSISRVPGSGDLLAIWNRNPGAKKRNPLVAGISNDEGKTWTHIRAIEEAGEDAWAYPAVTWIGSEALVTYFNYQGGLSLQLKILPADWFYE